MDIPRPLAKPRAVDKALEVLQESGNLIMENIKEGGNGFGRDLQEDALKIFTQCKQIPVAMERVKLLIYSSPAPGQELQATSSGGWQVMLE